MRAPLSGGRLCAVARSTIFELSRLPPSRDFRTRGHPALAESRRASKRGPLAADRGRPGRANDRTSCRRSWFRPEARVSAGSKPRRLAPAREREQNCQRSLGGVAVMLLVSFQRAIHLSQVPPCFLGFGAKGGGPQARRRRDRVLMGASLVGRSRLGWRSGCGRVIGSAAIDCSSRR